MKILNRNEKQVFGITKVAGKICLLGFCSFAFKMKRKLNKCQTNASCIPDEKIQVNPNFWSGSEILF